MELDKLTIVWGFVAFVCTYWLTKTIYNLFLHPLARFPGPRWAAGSYLHEFYYDMLQGGQYYKTVIQMHEKYGPLVRVNPDELSFNDPFFYEKVYSAGGQKRNKSPTLTTILPTSTIIGHLMFGSLAVDVISHYAYGESFGDLDKPGFPCELEQDVKGVLMTQHVRKFFPCINAFMVRLPAWLVVRISPSIASYVDFEDRITRYSKSALKESQEEEGSIKPRTLFDALVSSKVPAPEKTLQRLKDESTTILFAGVDTTAQILTCTMCYLITYPDVLAKLRAELQPYVNATWTQFEALPYLTAVINESLRYECSFTNRFPRSLVESLAYKDMLIPAGTTIGAMPYLLNSHPDIFPDPYVFRPERWIEAKARGEHLDKYLITFTKGSRACLGINLAYAELYLTVAAMVQNFNLELVDSSIENITPDRDFGLAFDKDYKFGVNFRVAKILQE
ncbi:hypothetical protein G6011_04257 [Alternaria panax]|uniref:Cytochrome P450 monooxygenase n=1 Tax=Alternaria panax TaxID=48097 RepID=A0AAD4IGN9_9PLEO|nr:hypothetical protein G6011_04257 [Alternaria panax]